jgi:hypothetical protein
MKTNDETSARGAVHRLGPSQSPPGVESGAARSPMISLPRLARAVHLNVQPLGDGRYRVSGGRDPHTVETQPAPSCNCMDALYRPAERCAHRLAVALHRGHPRVLAALRRLVLAPKRSVRRSSTAGVTATGLVA